MFPLKIVIFYSYVSLPEDICWVIFHYLDVIQMDVWNRGTDYYLKKTKLQFKWQNIEMMTKVLGVPC